MRSIANNTVFKFKLSNGYSIRSQQTDIRSTQSGILEDMNDKITAAQLTQILEAKFNQMFDRKIEDFTKDIENKLSTMNTNSPIINLPYFTAHLGNSFYKTPNTVIPFSTVVADRNRRRFLVCTKCGTG